MLTLIVIVTHVHDMCVCFVSFPFPFLRCRFDKYEFLLQTKEKHLSTQKQQPLNHPSETISIFCMAADE